VAQQLRVRLICPNFRVGGDTPATFAQLLLYHNAGYCRLQSTYALKLVAETSVPGPICAKVCCAVSKRYESDFQPYWYAFHPKGDEFLGEATDEYLILSCMDRDEAFAVPYSWLTNNKMNLNMTENGGRSYWHIAVTTLDGGTWR
jgi:hypothetical protein